MEEKGKEKEEEEGTVAVAVEEAVGVEEVKGGRIGSDERKGERVLSLRNPINRSNYRRKGKR